MRKPAFCGLPHSESEVYYVKSSANGLAPCRSQNQRYPDRHLGGNSQFKAVVTDLRDGRQYAGTVKKKLSENFFQIIPN